MTCVGNIWELQETPQGGIVIEKLHTELLPLVDRLQDAGTRGVYNLARVPYRGMQWTHRAFQRDPFVVAFTQVLPSAFGTFTRRDDLIPQRRLVFHSNALNLDLVLRRRGSLGAFKQAGSVVVDNSGVQEELFPLGEGAIGGTRVARLAALIWDTPELNKKHKAIGPTPIVVRLAVPGHSLDDNEWESGFPLPSTAGGHDLIPGKTEYRHDMPDWDVESETDAQ
jgi:hypothetical protein